jgi:O-antigen ligase
MFTNFKISLSSANLTKILALCLVIPVYMNFFVSKDPLFQFIGYLVYLVPIGILVISRQIEVSNKFIAYWVVFSILLIVPSIINLSSGRLESDLINLKALFSKWIFLSALLLFFDSWFKKHKDTQFHQLLYYLFLFMLPMISIIFIKVITPLTPECAGHFFNPHCRPNPFKAGAFITSEFLLLFGLLCLALRPIALKIMLLTLTIIALTLLHARTALFATIVASATYTVLPLMYKYKKKMIIPAALITLILSFYTFIYLIDNTFIGREIITFTHRTHMWQLGLETIQASPWFGIGFDVTPNYYSFTFNHHANTIHNMFIRIATENGLPLLIFITTTFIYSLYRVFQAKNFYAIAVILSVIIFHSFSTRHISINLLNIIFYFIIMKSLYSFKK